jgi:cation diffusion facilitator family transporter
MAKSSGGESTGTVLLALSMNLLVFVCKAAGGFISGSSALLSEAAHSLGDTMNQVFLLTALKRSNRPADEQHPFGYGQERFFWSLIAAVGIFVAGAIFSFFQGYQALTTDEHETAFDFYISYITLAVALVAEGASLMKALRQTRREAHEADHGILDYVRVSDDPTVKTVASEDTAAVIGIAFAFVGIGLHQLTGNPLFDALASFAIGALLSYVAYALGRDNMGLLIGESAEPRVREAMRAQLEGYPEIDEVLELYTIRIGTRELLVAVRLDLAENLDSNQVEEVSTRIDHDLHDRFPDVKQVFLDATNADEEDRESSSRRMDAEQSPRG